MHADLWTATLYCEFSHYLFTPIDGNIYVFQNQIQVFAVAQTVAPKLHLPFLGPGAGWGCLLNAPLSLKEPHKHLWSAPASTNTDSEDSQIAIKKNPS